MNYLLHMLFIKDRQLIFALFGIFVLNFHQNVNCQQTQRKLYVIRARIVDNKDHHPIVFAQVINKNMRWGVVSDTLGLFSLSANMTDTLYISAIGYYPTFIAVSEALIRQIRIAEIPLEEQVYEVGQVNVYSLGTYEQFKYKVIHSNPPPNNLQKVNENIQKEIAKIPRHPLQEQMSIPLGSPVTAVYMWLSKEGKGQKKFQKAKEEHKLFVATNLRFNRDIVSKATGLTGDMLDRFMTFCRPDFGFILTATDYDIYKRILEDYELFMKKYGNKGQPIKK